MNSHNYIMSKIFNENPIIVSMQVSKQVVGLDIPDKSMTDHSFHGFTDAT